MPGLDAHLDARTFTQMHDDPTAHDEKPEQNNGRGEVLPHAEPILLGFGVPQRPLLQRSLFLRWLGASPKRNDLSRLGSTTARLVLTMRSTT